MCTPKYISGTALERWRISAIFQDEHWNLSTYLFIYLFIYFDIILRIENLWKTTENVFDKIFYSRQYPYYVDEFAKLRALPVIDTRLTYH